MIPPLPKGVKYHDPRHVHDFRKRGLLGFDQEMNVGRHKDIGVEKEGITLFVFFQEPQIEFVILSGFENLCALIPPGDDVVKGSWKMDPRLPCHEKFLSKPKSLVNTYFLMPDPIFQSCRP